SHRSPAQRAALDPAGAPLAFGSLMGGHATWTATLDGDPGPDRTLEGSAPMAPAVIRDAVRSPLGRRNGGLSKAPPVDLAAAVPNARVTRNDLAPGLVDDVIMGTVMQVGAQWANPGRKAAPAAGWPEAVVGPTVARQCGSSQQAVHFA